MDSAILRIIDVNCNRAREALRVLEDYARFSLNHAGISSSLKALRHDLAGATEEVQAQAIHVRDTQGDVGTTIKTDREQSRHSQQDMVIAAGKRLGEALRSIEESLKTIDGARAAQVEKIRYRFYDVEKLIAGTFSRSLAGVRLCVLVTESLCSGPWLKVAEQAILGGADCLQLREKSLESGEFLARAKEFVALCRQHRVISIVNDRADIAVLSDADGVHVGQGDLPIAEARKIVGGRIVGVSTHRIEQAQLAQALGANYIGIGPVFPSQTKPRAILPGLAYAREVVEKITIPALAIAGITLANVDEVLKAGVKAVAISSAVISAIDVKAAASAFCEKLGR